MQDGKEKDETGQFSIPNLEQAVNVLRVSDDKLKLSMTLSNLSLAYQQKGEWTKAGEAIRKSQTVLESISSNTLEKRKLLAHALEVEGKLKLSIGETEEALSLWQKASTKFYEAGDKTGENRTKIHQTLALQELGFYRQAFKTLIKPVQLIKTQPPMVQAIAFRSLGNILRIVGDTEELSELEKTLDFLQLDVNSVKELKCFQPSEDGKIKLNYLDQSHLLLWKSFQISESPQDKAEALLSLGNTARSAYKRAQDAYERAQIPNDKTAAECQSQWAANYYQQVVEKVEVVEKVDSVPLIQKIQAQLNKLSLLIDYEEWVQRSKEAYLSDDPSSVKAIPKEWEKPLPPEKISSQIDSLPLSRTAIYARINLAKSLMKLLAMSDQSSPSLQKTMAVKESKNTRSQEIEELLQKAAEQAQKLKDKRAESYAWGYLGRYFYEMNLEDTDELTKKTLLQDAYKWTKEALLLSEELAEESQDPTKKGKEAKDIAYQWQWQLGRVLTKQADKDPKKLQQAIPAYEIAVNILESVRGDLTSFNNPDLQFSFRDSIEPVYRELVDLLLSPKEKVEDKQANASNQDNLQKVKEAQEALQKAQKAIEDLQVAELENFLRCRLTNTKLVPIYKVIDDQNLNAAVIYPIILDNRLEVILKLPQEKKLIRRTTENVTKKEVDRIVKLLQKEITGGVIAKQQDAHFQQVYEWVLRNIEKELEDSKVETLVFVLDGALRNIPMAALYDGTNYVIQKYSVALNLGIQLTEPKPLQKGKFKVLAAGTGNFLDPHASGALEFVETELKQIKQTLPEQVNNNILGPKFTTKNLQQQIQSQRFDVVHLATHGVFSSSPDKTYIQAYERKFYLNEMSNLFRSREETRPDRIGLLVLSACYTAKGDKRAVLGIAGVSVQTGSDSTVASLFKAEDRSATVLMEQFYQNLGTHNVTKAEALRRAQEYLLNHEYKQPQFWAPFVLVGNWR
ncbi:CHAT domain-containing protein [Scytonema sp. PRP1]|uniref:CHAT domain-containing protein n=1 Tax=Scytonema sp. PRP1 TaxID=3120513 RepID=UPI00300CC755